MLNKLPRFVAMAFARGVQPPLRNAPHFAPGRQSVRTMSLAVTWRPNARMPLAQRRQVSWEDIAPSTQRYWKVLGWNAINWNSSNTQPLSEGKDWQDLTAAERKAAVSLQYDAKLWNEECSSKMIMKASSISNSSGQNSIQGDFADRERADWRFFWFVIFGLPVLAILTPRRGLLWSGGRGGGGGGGCFVTGTPVLMADGKTIKRIEELQLGDMTAGGRVLAVMKFDGDDVADMFNYNGVCKVTADHAVMEDGRFCRVRNSRLGRKLPPGSREAHPDVVYDVITTDHRIHVPVSSKHPSGSEVQVFADYIELPYYQQDDVYDLFLTRLNHNLDAEA